jgi:16S rRNA (cytidine(1402)-2'-O)-methyltransferase
MSMSATATYSKVLDLAQELVGHQTLSTHTLYMIASPIGNLADISIRALFVLQKVDFIACEDTRHTQSLCRSYGLEIASNQWISVHQHNEWEGAQKVTQALQSGARVAYLSDAGTPGVSDPGSRLVSACVDQGLRVVPIPGPSSVTTLLSASGAHQGDDQSFIFLGFQAYEYYHAYHELNLKLTSGIYGSTFFMLTGFHGFHVFLGGTMLAIVLRRMIRGDFTSKHHFAFEGAAWYWHFVDVVWLGLYIAVYWM